MMALQRSEKVNLCMRLEWHNTITWQTERNITSRSCRACWCAINHGTLNLTLHWQMLTNIHDIGQKLTIRNLETIRLIAHHACVLLHNLVKNNVNKFCGSPPQYAPAAPPLQVDLWPFDLGSGVRLRVTCHVCYLCANFSLPRPLCSRLKPDVHDRETDRRQIASSLNAPAY